jgi:AraC-like DNA-binding protein
LTAQNDIFAKFKLTLNAIVVSHVCGILFNCRSFDTRKLKSSPMLSSLTAFFNTIILLGIVQGFIMTGLLFFSKKQRYANRLLAALILLISLASFNLYGNYQNWFGSNLLRFLADLIPLVVVMPFGPLIYFYVQSSLNPAFKVSKKNRLHFLPVIIDFVPSLTAVVFIIGLVFHIFNNNPRAWGNFIDTYNVYADIPRWFSMTFYVGLSAKYISQAKTKPGGDGLQANFKWLQQLLRILFVFQCIWLLFLVPYIIPKYSDKLIDAVDWYPLYIPMAVIVYWLGIKGYVVSHISPSVKKAIPLQLILTPQVIEKVVEALNRVMQEDKLYLNPGLNLDLVAQQTNLPSKTISSVLNQHMHKSFNEFVNGYRVEAFKQKVLQPHLNNFTIAGIASECGFNSQATFQRTFKQATGMSPSEFRKQEPEIN